jgi:hypothetical protein
MQTISQSQQRTFLEGLPDKTDPERQAIRANTSRHGDRRQVE